MSQSRPVLYIRSLLFMFGFALCTICFAFPVTLSFLLPIKWRFAQIKVYCWLCVTWLRVCCGLRYRMEGVENVPNTPCVVFAKHQSTLETLVLTMHLVPAAYVAKRELVWVPFFGWGLAAVNQILINRASGRKAVAQIVSQARERLASGMWVIIFPEGTRRAAGAPPDYKIGGAIMAVETSTKILPVAINSGDFWPRHSLIKWPGEVVFSFGPLIDPEGLSPDQVREQVRDWIEPKMTEISAR
ncbi:MAG: lysophospholipid acyltransferase family protein [Pseudomonadota bacterium]